MNGFHAEIAHTNAHESGHVFQVFLHNAAQVQRHAARLGCVHHILHQTQHGRVIGGGGLFPPGNTTGILHQIVQVHGQKVSPGVNDLPCHQRSGGDFDQAANGQIPAERQTFFFQALVAALHLVHAGAPGIHIGDHGEQHLQGTFRCLHCSLHQGGKLGKRRGLFLHPCLHAIHPLAAVVRSPIVGAHGNGFAAAVLDACFIGFHLLGFSQLLDYNGFRAQQSNAGSPRLNGFLDGLRCGAGCAGQQNKRRAVPRAAGGRSQRVGQGVAVLQLLPPCFHLPQLGGGGVNDQLGVFSIHHCAAARSSSGYPLAQLEYRRDAHAARHNGGVAGFTVRFRGKSQDHARCLTKQIAGVKQLCRQDAGLRQVQTAAGAAIQNIHHAAAGIAHIHAALPDVIIIHVF